MQTDVLVMYVMKTGEDENRIGISVSKKWATVLSAII